MERLINKNMVLVACPVCLASAHNLDAVAGAHLSAILTKLNLKNRTQIAVTCFQELR